MPVHRPDGKGRPVVVAFTDELEVWFRQSRRKQQRAPNEPSLAPLFTDLGNLVADAAELASRICMLQERMRQLLPPSHRSSPTRRRSPRRARGSLLRFPAPSADAEVAR